MIKASELRLGNHLLFKFNGKITIISCDFVHFEQLHKGGASYFYPVMLKSELLQQCGFIENNDYPLLPQAREFKQVLPVIGNANNELYGYVKNNGECFVRAMVNGNVASINFFHLHQVQNLFFFLTGNELEIKK